MRWLALAVICAGCGTDSASTPPLGGSLTINGDVLDFQTGQPITSAAMVTTSGLTPAPMISVTGSSFTIDGVPENSSFNILASSQPVYHATYSPAVYVLTTGLDHVQAFTVAEAYLMTLAGAFNVSPSASNGILLLHLVDAVGKPQAGVAGSNLVLAGAGGASGPKFLDANLAAQPGATTTSTSGWVVFYDVTPGAVSLGQAANATVTLAMPTSPVAAGAVTIATVQVTQGAPMGPPTNVSFGTQVTPIFTARGCTGCHSGGGPGKNLGNLMLDAGVNQTYRQLTDPTYPGRINLMYPEKSKVLTMPSYESPPDAHPNVTFTGPQDPDYVKILTWIREGAKLN